MKKNFPAFYFILLCTLFSFGNEHKPEIRSQKTIAPINEMVRQGLNACSEACSKISFKKTLGIPVKGRAMYRISYCGGAAPSEEMMEEMRKPKIFKGQLYFVKDKIKTKITTDANGHFSCTLPTGKYKIYLAQNRRGPESFWYDENLDGKWWAQQVFSNVEIKNSGEIKFVLDFTCSPTNRKRP